MEPKSVVKEPLIQPSPDATSDAIAALARDTAAELGVTPRPIPNNTRVLSTLVRVATGEDQRERMVLVHGTAMYVVSLPPGERARATVGQAVALDRTGNHIRITPIRQRPPIERDVQR